LQHQKKLKPVAVSKMIRKATLAKGRLFAAGIGVAARSTKVD